MLRAARLATILPTNLQYLCLESIWPSTTLASSFLYGQSTDGTQCLHTPRWFAKKAGKGPGRDVALPVEAIPDGQVPEDKLPAVIDSLTTQDLFRQSRYVRYYQDVLHRELMLKTNPMRWDKVPMVDTITLTIKAEDTRLNKELAERFEMLLYLVALEHIGGQPAKFLPPPNVHHTGKTTGVQLVIGGDRALDFLEKLATVVLPNITGFEGVGTSAADLVYPWDGELDSAPQVLEIAIPNLLLFPEFEPNFDFFERLKGVKLRVRIKHAANEQVVKMLMEAFAVPSVERVATA